MGIKIALMGTLFLIVPLWPISGSAIPINIDFGSASGSPLDTYGAASGQVGTWNTISSLGVTSGLVDLGGSSTSVSISLTGTDFGNSPGPGVDQALLGDMLYSSGGFWEVSLSNLDNGTYDIFYYAPFHTMNTGVMDINGVSVASLEGSINTLSQGVSWDLLSSVAITDGTLNLGSGVNFGTPWNGIAGIQIVEPGAVPVPAAVWLFGTALVGLIGFNKRRKAAV